MKLVLACVSSLFFASLGLSASLPGGLVIPRPGIITPPGGVTDPSPIGGFGPGRPIPISPGGGVIDPRGSASLKINIPTKVCITTTREICTGSGRDRQCRTETKEACLELKSMPNFLIPSDAVQVKVYDGVGKWSVYNNRGLLQTIQPGSRNLFNSN